MLKQVKLEILKKDFKGNKSKLFLCTHTKDKK